MLMPFSVRLDLDLAAAPNRAVVGVVLQEMRHRVNVTVRSFTRDNLNLVR